MNEQITNHSEGYENNRLVVSGLLIFCLLIVGESFGIEKPAPLILASLGLCAISIPTLVTVLTLTHLELGFKVTTRPKYYNWLPRVAIGSSLLAISLTFFHFSTLIGIIFLCAITYASGVSYFFIDQLQVNNGEEE